MSLFIFEYQILKWVFSSFRLLQNPESHWPFIYLSVPLTWHFHSRARTKSFPFPNLGGFLQVKIGDQGGSFSLASVAELSWQAGRQVSPWLIIIFSKTRHCPSKDQFEITKKDRLPPLDIPDVLSCAAECIKKGRQQCNALLFDRSQISIGDF